MLPWKFKFILCLLTSQKCVSSEVDKAMIQKVARHCELIFCILNSPKFDLLEVEKAMVQLVAINF